MRYLQKCYTYDHAQNTHICRHVTCIHKNTTRIHKNATCMVTFRSLFWQCVMNVNASGKDHFRIAWKVPSAFNLDNPKLQISRRNSDKENFRRVSPATPCFPINFICKLTLQTAACPHTC